MENQIAETFNNDIFTIVMVVLAVLAWKFMPRLIAGVPFLDAGDVKRKLDAGEVEVVIDVRAPGEYLVNNGHIPGAINLPFAELVNRLKAIAPELEPYKHLPVVVTCASEQRAGHAARSLKKAGFTNVAVLKGGMKGWKRAGLPLEKGVPDANAEPAVEAAPSAEPAKAAANAENTESVPSAESAPDAASPDGTSPQAKPEQG